MKKLGVFLGFVGSLVLGQTSFAWDCNDPAVDCNTLIVQSQPSGAGLASFQSAALTTQTDTHIVKVPSREDAHEIMDNLKQSPGVKLVEPAMVIELEQGTFDPIPEDPYSPSTSTNGPLPSESIFNAPDDPLFDFQNHFTGSMGSGLNIDDVWERFTASTIVVAVIDSGIDYEHVDLADNVWTNIGEIPDNGIDDDDNGYVDDVHGYNFYDDIADPYDDHMHGTHIAGIIGAVGNNGIGVAGLLWEVQLMGLRFTDENGIGNTAKAIKAIHYAVANGARVINMSWTVKASSGSSGSQALRNVVEYYENHGVIFAVAAGNGDASYQGINIDAEPVYPAAIPSSNIVSVAAANLDGELASYSNYGSKNVHIMAPGSGILSTIPGDAYGRMTGTSAATGLVSAAAAMILTEAPELTGTQVKNVLLNTVNFQSDLQGYVQSSGSLDLHEPLYALTNNQDIANQAPPSSAPSVSNNNGSSSSSVATSLDAYPGASCALVGKQSRGNTSTIPALILFALFILTLKRALPSSTPRAGI